MCEDKVAKWSAECLEQGFKFIGKSLEKPGCSIAECNVCGHVDSYHSGAMRKGLVRCSNCKIAQFSNECLAQGFKFIGKSSENSDYTIAECMTCGIVDVYVQSAMRDGRVRCEQCKNTKFSNECLENGFVFLHKVDGHNSLCECAMCHHQDIYQQVAMRKGRVRCKSCKNTQYSNECLEYGFKFIGKSPDNSNYSIAECNVFGHVDRYQQCAMRKGEVRCEQCLIQKYKEAVKPGWEYVDKSVIKKHTYIILKHNCSENLVTVDSSAFLKGVYDCPHCMHGHYDDPSIFYVIKVTHNNKSIIKIGISNNATRRFRKYGLPDDATLEIIHTEPFETKRLAVTFESTMKLALRDYKVDNEIAKEIFKDSGFTECLTVDSLEVITRLLTKQSTEQYTE